MVCREHRVYSIASGDESVCLELLGISSRILWYLCAGTSCNPGKSIRTQVAKTQYDIHTATATRIVGTRRAVRETKTMR